MTAKEFLKKFGYKGNEKLMNPHTGSVDTASNWACEAAAGDWDCRACKEGDEHTDGQCSGTAEDQFRELIHVKKDKNGDYVEV